MKVFKFISIFIFTAWLMVRFIYFGSFIRSCIYTGETIPVRSELASGTLSFVGPAAIYAEAYKPYNCVPEFNSIDHRIGMISNEKYFNDGRFVDPLKITHVNESSKIEFRVVGLIAITKHGISTIDSGSGPINYLILKDQNDVLYHVAHASLGINKGEEFLELNKTDGTNEILSSDSKLDDR